MQELWSIGSIGNECDQTLCMQPSDTAELVEKLEDAQMALGSMTNNRFSAPFRDNIGAWLGKLGVISEQVPSLCFLVCAM